jgi:hypothetical protein
MQKPESRLLDMVENLELFLYRKSDAIVSVTDAFKENLVRRGIRADKISVVRNGIDLKRYFPREKDSELLAQYRCQGKKIIGYIGTQGLSHGLMSVLKAAEMMRDQSDYQFLFIGTGAENAKLKDYVAQNRLSNVTFIPSQPKDQIARYWSLLDVTLICLKGVDLFKTVIPSKLFEAIGMGVPVLFSGPIGEASGIIKQDDVGILVTPEDPVAMKVGIDELFSKPKLLETFQLNANKAAKKYDRKTNAAAMRSIFEELVNK